MRPQSEMKRKFGMMIDSHGIIIVDRNSPNVSAAPRTVEEGERVAGQGAGDQLCHRDDPVCRLS